ncbi:hypothetical protein NVV94_02550 [Pseudomonas sp. LS1212]|uniref:dermonecrotic toxin domain-containing protein n=1 Tax=Pseudomonas sp. LS1212 TaxID=2972478 RepID=UPI00215D46DE|nr:DUF6543 domain-containing protein [Pseudomonas sp. LS1212]UVJ44507.1 hypothetical protein NVV94_02550 [Pseudomonas sp. LS1212]
MNTSVSTSPTQPDTPQEMLISSDTWSDYQALGFIKQQLTELLADLEPAQQQRYLALAREGPRRQKILSDTLAQFRRNFESQLLQDLTNALRNKANKTIDPRLTYLHTRTLTQQRRSKRAASGEQIESIRSQTLWDAAVQNFAFNIAHGTGSGLDFTRASYINSDPDGRRNTAEVLAVEDFVAVVRELDPGTRLQTKLQTELPRLLSSEVTAYQQALLEFALLEAYRTTSETGIDQQQLAMLERAVNLPGALQWKLHSLKLGRSFADALVRTSEAITPVKLFSEHLQALRQKLSRQSRSTESDSLPLPFFVIQRSAWVFSYFPDRPGGAWRRHLSHTEAVDSFRDQLREAVQTRDMAWLTRWMPLAHQQQLLAFLKTENVDRNQLNWLAKLLYDAFGEQTPPAQLIEVSRDLAESGNQSLLQALALEQELTIAGDLSLLATTNGNADFEAVKQGLLFVFSEVMELLTLSVPGGVTGLNRTMLAATFGSLGYQAVTASHALLNGRSADFVQAVGDITELVISGRLQSVGAHLSARRTRALINALGRPRCVIQADGSTALQLSGTTAQRPVDVSPLTDAQLLQKMLQPDLPTLDTTVCARLLALSGVERQQLEAIWQGKVPPPWQITDVLQWYPSHDRDTSATQTPDPDGPLAVVLQRFAELSPAAATELLRQHPELNGITAQSVLEPQLIAAVLQTCEQSRALRALCALADSTGREWGNDSEALCCNLLTLQAGWPDSLGMRIRVGSRSHSYGLECADTFISLDRVGTTYISNGQAMPPLEARDSLINATWHSLDAPQREAMGYRIDDSSRLGEHIIEQALHYRSDLPQLLAEPSGLPLSSARLQPFRLQTDLSNVTADAHGIYALDGRRFVVIDNESYRVMHDRDASSPQQAIWRIVKPQDPIAANEQNIFVAGIGLNEAITDREGRWVAATLPGAGGMPSKGGRLEAMKRENLEKKNQTDQARRRKDQETQQQLNDVSHEMHGLVEVMQSLHPKLDHPDHETKTEARSALAATYYKLIRLITRKIELLQAGDPQRNRAGIIAAHVNRLQCLEKIILGLDLAFTEEVGVFVTDPYHGEHAHYRGQRNRILKHMEEKRPFLKKREAYIEELRTRYPGAEAEGEIATLYKTYPAKPWNLEVAAVLFRMELLSIGDPMDSSNPVAFKPEAVLQMIQFHETSVAYDDLVWVPTHHQMTVLDHLQRQLESVRTAFEQMRGEFSSPREGKHLEDTVKGLVAIEQDCQVRLEALYQQSTDNASLAKELDDIDLGFLPAQPGPSHAPATRRKLIKVKQRGIDSIKLGQERVTDNGETFVDIIGSIDGTGTAIQTYEKPQGGGWKGTKPPPAPPRSPPTLPTLMESAQAQLGEVTRDQAKATRDAQAKLNPTNIVEYLETKAEQLDNTAREIEAATIDQASTESRSLIEQLKDASVRLKKTGEQTLIEMYKAPEKLDISRLLYLIKMKQVSVVKLLDRGEHGKGTARHFLDIYLIKDAQGERRDLWHAHFHYPARDTPSEQFSLKGGHLKTLKQSGLGRTTQARDEQQGRAHSPIWRAAFDSRSARKLFALVSQT